MNLVLMRIDSFTRPEVVGLPFDYKLSLAMITAHPWQTPAGILCYSRPAARVLNGGLDYETVLATLPALEKLGLLIFDTKTLEVWPTDFFEVNLAPDQPGNSRYLRGQTASLMSCSSEKIGKAWRAAAIVAPLEKHRSVAVPANFLSSLSDAASTSLMASLMAVAIALICHPDVSQAGSARLNSPLLGDMMGLDLNTVSRATQMLNEMEIIYIDKRTNEYWFKKWFVITGKLTTLEKIRSIALVVQAIKSGYIRRAIVRAISRQTEGKFDHLFESQTNDARTSKQVSTSLSKLPDNSADKPSTCSTQHLPSLPNPPAFLSGGGDIPLIGKEDYHANPTADAVVAALRWKYQRAGNEVGPGLEHILRQRWSGNERGGECHRDDVVAVSEHRQYLQRILANKTTQEACSRPDITVNTHEQELVGKSFVTTNGGVVLVQKFGAVIANKCVPLSKILKMLHDGDINLQGQQAIID